MKPFIPNPLYDGDIGLFLQSHRMLLYGEDLASLMGIHDLQEGLTRIRAHHQVWRIPMSLTTFSTVYTLQEGSERARVD